MLALIFPNRVRVKETECSESGWGTVFGYDYALKSWIIRLDNDVRLSNEFLDNDYVTRSLLFDESEILEIDTTFHDLATEVFNDFQDYCAHEYIGRNFK